MRTNELTNERTKKEVDENETEYLNWKLHTKLNDMVIKPNEKRKAVARMELIKSRIRTDGTNSECWTNMYMRGVCPVCECMVCVKKANQSI